MLCLIKTAKFRSEIARFNFFRLKIDVRTWKTSNLWESRGNRGVVSNKLGLWSSLLFGKPSIFGCNLKLLVCLNFLAVAPKWSFAKIWMFQTFLDSFHCWNPCLVVNTIQTAINLWKSWKIVFRKQKFNFCKKLLFESNFEARNEEISEKLPKFPRACGNANQYLENPRSKHKKAWENRFRFYFWFFQRNLLTFWPNFENILKISIKTTETVDKTESTKMLTFKQEKTRKKQEFLRNNFNWTGWDRFEPTDRFGSALVRLWMGRERAKPCQLYQTLPIDTFAKQRPFQASSFLRAPHCPLSTFSWAIFFLLRHIPATTTFL